jgi:hypothetical protein
VNHITHIRLRHRGVGLARSIARAHRWEIAEQVSRVLLRVAEAAEPAVRQRITDLAYLEGAKADVLRALLDGHYHDAREALACWRCLHRAIYGRKARALLDSLIGSREPNA